jgi:hypothetical protein
MKTYNELYELAAKTMVRTIVKELSKKYNWPMNKTIDTVVETETYKRIMDSKIKAWKDSPIHLTYLIDKEIRGEQIGMKDLIGSGDIYGEA